MTKRMLLQLFVFVFLPFVVATAADPKDNKDSPWNYASETEDSFVPFPDDVQSRLQNEVELYGIKKESLPLLRVFQKYPEEPQDDTTTSRRIWPKLKSIQKRLHPIPFWPRAQYYVVDGLEFGCRKRRADDSNNGGDRNNDDTLPVTSNHCYEHCLHQGRYCLDEPNLPSDYRREALKEIVRRLCMDDIYSAKGDPNSLFISYLEHFDSMECKGNPETDKKPSGGFHHCSRTAMRLAGMNHSDIVNCNSEDNYESNNPIEVMERNLRQFAKYQDLNNYTALPFVTINNNRKLPTNPRKDEIFQSYCSFFPSNIEQPLACHACKDCSNVRECLWTLKCNNKDFDPSNVKPDVLSLSVPSYGKEGEEETTAAAAEQEEEEETAVSNESKPDPQGEGGRLWWIFVIIAFTCGFFLLCCSRLHKYYRRVRTSKKLKELTVEDGIFRDFPELDGSNNYALGGRVGDGLFRDIPDSGTNNAMGGGHVGDILDESTKEQEDVRLRSHARELLSLADNWTSARNLNQPPISNTKELEVKLEQQAKEKDDIMLETEQTKRNELETIIQQQAAEIQELYGGVGGAAQTAWEMEEKFKQQEQQLQQQQQEHIALQETARELKQLVKQYQKRYKQAKQERLDTEEKLVGAGQEIEFLKEKLQLVDLLDSPSFLEDDQT